MTISILHQDTGKILAEVDALEGACYDRHTLWPEDFDPQEPGAILSPA